MHGPLQGGKGHSQFQFQPLLKTSANPSIQIFRHPERMEHPDSVRMFSGLAAALGTKVIAQQEPLDCLEMILDLATALSAQDPGIHLPAHLCHSCSMQVLVLACRVFSLYCSMWDLICSM
ncbi:hypothetical protein MJG53_013845 [Ovis ammon polii x Ovis aries]|uniref:Uncharacterized protein n=1 Tax=Ovis ammon polii x Ovis aries TaxID=2918886 RepID=A0ACB9UK27_9CETA|nr:hypothetical protein MJG53_013845 [Ovis ammon polii x Ovis aries]